MSLPPGFLDELRGRISLAQVVGRRVTWEPRKTNTARGDYWAPCPFHTEKTASFHVDDRKGFYHCFGCHAGGDAIDFVRAVDNLGFMEAVEALARDAGMSLPARDPRAAERADARARLVEAMEAAVRFYRLQLGTARAAEARAYLDRRALAAESRERFELGFAPDGRTALVEHMVQAGFRVPELSEAGLVILPDDGGAPFDRFRNRIMFPIRDARGRAIAFGGRALDPGARAKYLNSPETPLFDKSRTLYNLGPARAAAGRAGALVVAEGYMDVIALAQAGLGHAVAPLGTAVTEDQLELLWRVVPEPLIALDGDRAGLAAGQRLVDLALPRLVPGRALRFVLMPPEQDPDDVIRAGGLGAMQALIDDSRPIVELLWLRETEGQSLDSPDRRAALDQRLRAHLDKIRDPGLREHYRAEIARRRREILPARTAAPRARDGARPGRPRPLPAAATSPASPAARNSPLARAAGNAAAAARVRECAILAGCLNHPAIAAALEAQLERSDFLCPDLAEVRDALLSCLAEPLHGQNQATGESIRAAVTARVGAARVAAVFAPGQVRANPHLGPGAAPERATEAIEGALMSHAASTGLHQEVREAAEALAGIADEGLTWRLREAAEAAHRAAARLAPAPAEAAAGEADLSATLQSMIDREIWRKPRNPR